MSESLSGLIAAPFTPMAADGSVNLAAIGPYVRMLAANGVAGAFVCGTTGESMSLTIEERMSVAERWREAAPDGFAVIVWSPSAPRPPPRRPICPSTSTTSRR